MPMDWDVEIADYCVYVGINEQDIGCWYTLDEAIKAAKYRIERGERACVRSSFGNLYWPKKDDSLSCSD